jgi:hypothetical protein
VFETSEKDSPLTLRHIPEDRNYQPHRNEMLIAYSFLTAAVQNITQERCATVSWEAELLRAIAFASGAYFLLACISS